MDGETQMQPKWKREAKEMNWRVVVPEKRQGRGAGRRELSALD